MYSTGRSLVRPRSRTTTLPASGWSSGANTATSAAGNPAASARAATAFAATVVPRACVELIAMSSLRMSRARDSNFCGGRGADVWPCAPIAALTAASASQRRDIDILLEFDSQFYQPICFLSVSPPLLQVEHFLHHREPLAVLLFRH